MFRTEKSAKMFEEGCKFVAGGVSSGVRSAAGPYPIYFERGKGSRIYDVDGNEYIDYLLAFGPLILGHCPANVMNAVKEQLDKGTMFGSAHELETKLSRKLTRIIACADLVRYNNSGSEADQAVLRLARAYTGKNKIIKFEGNYHGWFDNIFVSYLPDSLNMIGLKHSPWKVLGSPGQCESVLQDLTILPWNDLEIVEKTIKAHKHEIAAVITEPIMSNCGVILPKKGYLEGLREITKANDALLIFDEVITGFRVALGGAQEYYDVTPDLCTFAKAFGGGYPISGIGGRKDMMDLIASKKVLHTGTYNSNPFCLAAALAVVTELERNDGAVIEHITRLGKKLIQGIEAIAQRTQVKVRIQGPGPFFCVSFTDKEITNFRDSFSQDKNKYRKFRRKLLVRGVHIFPTEKGLWYISAAHTDKDIETTLGVVEDVFKKGI